MIRIILGGYGYACVGGGAHIAYRDTVITVVVVHSFLSFPFLPI